MLGLSWMHSLQQRKFINVFAWWFSDPRTTDGTSLWSELEPPNYLSQHFTPAPAQITIKPLLKVCLILAFTPQPLQTVH